MIAYEDLCRALDAFRQRKQQEAEMATLEAAQAEAPVDDGLLASDEEEHPQAPRADQTNPYGATMAAGDSSSVEVSDSAIVVDDVLAHDPGHDDAAPASEAAHEGDVGDDEKAR